MKANLTVKTFLQLLLIIFLIEACKKSPPGNNGGNNGGNGNGNGNGGGNVPPIDPPVASTIGFFLDDWTSRSFIVPISYTDTIIPASTPSTTISIDASTVLTKIPATVFGQNANSWMTQIVTQNSLMNHITNLRPGIIRFPGGSISDTYFWNAASAAPADAPVSLLDADGNTISNPYWYGKRNDGWTISVDSYYQLLQQSASTGIITVNYGYARYGTSADPVAEAAHLAADWVRYDNGRTKYWEIGNECNGVWEAGYRINTANNKDGQPQLVTGSLYGQHFNVFADSMKKAAHEIGKTIYIGAYILEAQPQSWQTPTDQNWNAGVLGAVNTTADFYIIHSYYTPYQQNSTADVILNTAFDNTANMMNYVKANLTSAGGSIKPVALTEWNITSQGSMQQVSFVNGMHAAILLGEALKNNYGQTSRWDLANGWSNGNDHGLFNIGDEPGVTIWNPRPAFYYMYYFQRTVGDRLLKSTVSGSLDILAYASSFTSGEKGVIIVNKAKSAQAVSVSLQNATAGAKFYFYTLTGGTDNGEFSRKVFVNGNGPTESSGGPSNNYTSIKPYSATTQNGIKLTLSPMSVVYMVIEK